jgi:hypothetical protein
MPSGVIHPPRNSLASVWRRCKAVLQDTTKDTDPKTTPCPWCEGAGMLYDGKSGLLVYCDCCNRTGYIAPLHESISPLAPSSPSTSH